MSENLLEGSESPEMLIRTAREALRISQSRFAALIGRDQSLVYRREKGESGVSESAAALAHAILRLSADLGSDAVLEVLESVPKEKRSETAALVALMVLAIKSRRLPVIEAIVSFDLGNLSLADEEDQPMAVRQPHQGARNLIDALKRDIREDSLEAFTEEERRYADQAVSGLAQAYDALWMIEGLRRKREEAQKKKGDGGGGG